MTRVSKTISGFAIVVGAGFLQGISMGCSSTSETPALQPSDGATGADALVATDALVSDALVSDTRGKPDSEAVDSAVLCDQDLATDFVCTAPAKKAGSTACSEAMLQEAAVKCLTAAAFTTSGYKTPKECSDWQAINVACNACIQSWGLDTLKIMPDRDKCYWSVFDDKCGKAVSCYFDCIDAVCGGEVGCDDTPGTGASGKNSEYDDCATRARFAGNASRPKGRCYDIAAKDGRQCLNDATSAITPCIVDEWFTPTGTGGDLDPAALQPQVVTFWRGACRDNGDWTNATSGGDAGPLSDAPVTTDASADSASDVIATDAAAPG